MTISGTNFSTTPGQDQVSVNGTAATVTAATATQLTVTVPSGATSGHLTVTTPGGAVTSTQDFFVPPAGYSTAQVSLTTRTTLGSTPSASFTSANTIGLLVFDAAAGQRLSVEASNVTIGGSGCCSTVLSLLKPDGSALVGGAYVGTAGGFVDTVTAAAAGTYTLVVVPQNGATGSLSL